MKASEKMSAVSNERLGVNKYVIPMKKGGSKIRSPVSNDVKISRTTQPDSKGVC